MNLLNRDSVVEKRSIIIIENNFANAVIEFFFSLEDYSTFCLYRAYSIATKTIAKIHSDSLEKL